MAPKPQKEKAGTGQLVNAILNDLPDHIAVLNEKVGELVAGN